MKYLSQLKPEIPEHPVSCQMFCSFCSQRQDRNGRSRLLLLQLELRRLKIACGTMNFNNNNNVTSPRQCDRQFRQGFRASYRASGQKNKSSTFVAVTVVRLSARNIVSCRYCRRITVDHRRQIYVEFQNQKEQNRKASKASKADLFSISSGFVEFTEDSLFSCAKAGCPYPISKRSIWCLNSWKQRNSSFSMILWCLPSRAKW